MFLRIPAHPGSPGQRAVKRLCVFVTHTFKECKPSNKSNIMMSESTIVIPLMKSASRKDMARRNVTRTISKELYGDNFGNHKLLHANGCVKYASSISCVSNSLQSVYIFSECITTN